MVKKKDYFLSALCLTQDIKVSCVSAAALFSNFSRVSPFPLYNSPRRIQTQVKSHSHISKELPQGVIYCYQPNPAGKTLGCKGLPVWTWEHHVPVQEQSPKNSSANSKDLFGINPPSCFPPSDILALHRDSICLSSLWMAKQAGQKVC